MKKYVNAAKINMEKAKSELLQAKEAYERLESNVFDTLAERVAAKLQLNKAQKRLHQAELRLKKAERRAAKNLRKQETWNPSPECVEAIKNHFNARLHGAATPTEVNQVLKCTEELRLKLGEIGERKINALIEGNSMIHAKVDGRANAQYVRKTSEKVGTYVAYKAVDLQFSSAGEMKETVSNIRFHKGNVCLLSLKAGIKAVSDGVRAITLNGCDEDTAIALIKKWTYPRHVLAKGKIHCSKVFKPSKKVKAFKKFEPFGLKLNCLNAPLFCLGQMKNSSKSWKFIMGVKSMIKFWDAFRPSRYNITSDPYRAAYCLNEVERPLPEMTAENTLVVDLAVEEEDTRLFLDPEKKQVAIKTSKESIDHCDGAIIVCDKQAFRHNGQFGRGVCTKAGVEVNNAENAYDFLKVAQKFTHDTQVIPEVVFDSWGNPHDSKKIKFVVPLSAAKAAKLPRFTCVQDWLQDMRKASGSTSIWCKDKQQKNGSASCQHLLGMEATAEEITAVVKHARNGIAEAAKTAAMFGQFADHVAANPKAATLLIAKEEYVKTAEYKKLNAAAGEGLLPYTRTLMASVDPWAVISAAFGMAPIKVIADECGYSRCLPVDLCVLTRDPGKVCDMTPSRIVWLPAVLARLLPINVLFMSWNSSVFTDRAEADFDTDMIHVWIKGCFMWDMIWRNACRQYRYIPLRRHLKAEKAKTEWRTFAEMVVKVATNDGTGLAGALNFFLQCTYSESNAWYQDMLWATALFNCQVDPLGYKCKINKNIITKADADFRRPYTQRCGKKGRKPHKKLYVHMRAVNDPAYKKMFLCGVPQLDIPERNDKFRSLKDVENGPVSWVETVSYNIVNWHKFTTADAVRLAPAQISIEDMLIRGVKGYPSGKKFDIRPFLTDEDIKTWDYRKGTPDAASWGQMLRYLSNDSKADTRKAEAQCIHDDTWADAEGDADRDFADACLREEIAAICAERKERRVQFLVDSFGEDWDPAVFYNTAVFYGMGGQIDPLTGKGQRIMGKLARKCKNGSSDPVEYGIDFLAKDFKEQMLRALRESAVKQELQPIAAAPEASNDETSSDDWSAYIDAEYDD